MTHRLALLFSFMLLALLGCGEPPPPEQFSVKGTVKWKGEPVKDATVKFVVTDTTWTTTAVTDGSGNYELQVFEGENKVSVTKTEEVEVEGQDGETKKVTAHVIPQNYSNPFQSGLKFTVAAEGENTYDIQLQGTVRPAARQ